VVVVEEEEEIEEEEEEGKLIELLQQIVEQWRHSSQAMMRVNRDRSS
jgi:hypothetical protein